MKPELARLLLASCVCLVVLSACSVLLVRDQRRVRQRGRRIDGVVAAYRASSFNALSSGYRLDLALRGATFTSRPPRSCATVLHGYYVLFISGVQPNAARLIAKKSVISKSSERTRNGLHFSHICNALIS